MRGVERTSLCPLRYTSEGEAFRTALPSRAAREEVYLDPRSGSNLTSFLSFGQEEVYFSFSLFENVLFI